MKVYQVDDYHKVVARNVEEAKKYYLEELCGEEEYFDGREVDIDKHKMWYEIRKLLEEFHHPPFKNWGYGLCCEVSLRIAIEMNKKHEEEIPYCLAVSSDLL